MDKILNVSSYIMLRYKDVSSKKLGEMKLHKLLYFVQRASFAETGEPLFLESFKGWKYGPVNEEIRAGYKKNRLVDSEISPKAEYLCNKVVEEYGQLESWRLSELTHEESSWIKARYNIPANQNGNKIIDINDIKEDAKKIRIFDSTWGAYLDEFPSVNEK